MSKQTSKCGKKFDENNQMDATTQCADYAQSISTAIRNENEMKSFQCKHPAHHRMKTATYVNLLPAEYWSTFGVQEGGDNISNAETADQAHRAINQSFIKRLQELENNVPHSLEAKLETYKEWVNVLQRLNKVLFDDFDEFEKTIEQHLQAHESRSNASYRQDINALVKFIRQAFHHKKWCLSDIKFETITPAYILGLDENNPQDLTIIESLIKGEYQPSKEKPATRKKSSSTDMYFMALAVEVAEKHDEINRFKQQMCCLEDEIQKAQQKIQFKDNVIRELRLDLKNLKKAFVHETESTTSSQMNSNNSKSLMDLVAIKAGKANSSNLNNNNEKSTSTVCKLATEKLSSLESQLNEILKNTDWHAGNSEIEKKSLKDIYEEFESNKTLAYQRISRIKEGLVSMLESCNAEDCQLILNGNDEIVLQAIRDYIGNMKSTHEDLNHQVEKLLIEKGEMAGKIEALNTITQKNCQTLKEIADLLSSTTEETFNYEEIYASSSTTNPFCRAIHSMKTKLTLEIDNLKTKLSRIQKDLEDKELELANMKQSTHESGDCPHRKQLENTLLQYQQQAILLANTQTDYLHIVGELKNELDTLSCHVSNILEDNSKITQDSQQTWQQLQQPTTGHISDPNTTLPYYDDNLVRTIRELEHQNDLLQAALEQATKQRDEHSCLELVAKNAYLQSRMQTMGQTLAEKDKLIHQQNIALERLAAPVVSYDAEALSSTRNLLNDANKRVETLENELDRCRNAEQLVLRDSRQLNNELVEAKKKNGELQTQLDRIRLLLKDSNENYESLQKKCEVFNKTTETQTKQIATLQQKIADLEKQITQDTMETKLLQHQVITLKQKEAGTLGELKALQDRYNKIDSELIDANDMVTKLKNSMHQNEDVHMRNMRHHLETNTELEKRLQKALEQSEKYQKEHNELNEICLQQTKTIDSFNKWKVEQRKADALSKESIEKYENHLKLLTEQNLDFLERCQGLHVDNQCLKKEIERLKVSKLSTKPGIFTPMNTNSNNLILSRLDQLRVTTQRVLQQKTDLRSDTEESVKDMRAMDVPTTQPYAVTSDYFSRSIEPTSGSLTRTNSPSSGLQFSSISESSNERLKPRPNLSSSTEPQ